MTIHFADAPLPIPEIPFADMPLSRQLNPGRGADAPDRVRPMSQGNLHDHHICRWCLARDWEGNDGRK